MNTVGSAGKTFSVTGWKLGWAFGPEQLIRNCQVSLTAFPGVARVFFMRGELKAKILQKRKIGPELDWSQKKVLSEPKIK